MTPRAPVPSLVDILGQRKPQSYYREAMWRPGVLTLAVHRPIPEGRKEKVTLWGWPLVESHWTWPGQEGRPLKVAVYSSCERVALTLNGRLVADRGENGACRNDLSYVRIEVVDTKGTVVPGARLEIRARVTGPGELAALASADPVDVAGHRGPSRRPYQGVAQAIVRPTGAGTMELVAGADGLPPARLAIRAR